MTFNADGSWFDVLVALVRGRLNGFGLLELAAGVLGAGLWGVRVSVSVCGTGGDGGDGLGTELGERV